jgi:hypothetical protein
MQFIKPLAADFRQQLLSNFMGPIPIRVPVFHRYDHCRADIFICMLKKRIITAAGWYVKYNAGLSDFELEGPDMTS